MPGALIATATETKTFPFRPSADLTLCKDANDVPTGQYFNTVSQTCTFSEKVIHTFTQWEDAFGVPFDPNTNPMPNISGNVVWTVAYNTTHYGYSPMGEDEPCFGVDGGCGYDSLNVGTKTFLGAPYAGSFANASDAFVNSSWTGGYCDNGLGGTEPCGRMRLAGPAYRPLGKIVLDQT